MHTRAMMVLVGVALCVSLGLPVSASQELGTIRVTGEPELVGEAVYLNRVGTMEEKGLLLEEAFGGGYVTREDLEREEFLQWLLPLAGEGQRRVIRQDGTAMFTWLPEGVYLLRRPNGAGSLIALPETDGSWMAQVHLTREGTWYVPPKTGQPITPVLGAMGMVLSAFCIGFWYESWHKRKD